MNPEAAQSLATQLGIPKVAGSAAEIFADPSIDAVLICSSTDTHADFVVQAAAAGKHIFCEKPLDHSLARIDWAISIPTLSCASAVDAPRCGVSTKFGESRNGE